MGMTPAEHRARAEQDLAAMQNGQYAPSTETYHGLALSAIAHVLAAVAAYLEPPVVPDVPGLPPGWQIDVSQGTGGDRRWGYKLTGPGDCVIATRRLWLAEEGALMAGISEAKVQQARLDLKAVIVQN